MGHSSDTKAFPHKAERKPMISQNKEGAGDSLVSVDLATPPGCALRSVQGVSSVFQEADAACADRSGRVVGENAIIFRKNQRTLETAGHFATEWTPNSLKQRMNNNW